MGGLALLLVAIDFGVSQSNRALQASVNQRQQFINQSIQLGRVNTTLIRSMAEAALNDKDDKLKRVLALKPARVSAISPPTPAAPGAQSKGP